MLGIRDSLVRTRIQIKLLSSVFLRICSYFFSYNLPVGIVSSVLKIQFFAKILQNFYFASIISVCSAPLGEKERFRIHTSDNWIRIREAQKHSDPDLYPQQHWRYGNSSVFFFLWFHGKDQCCGSGSRSLGSVCFLVSRILPSALKSKFRSFRVKSLTQIRIRSKLKSFRGSN